ncbi:MAG: histidine phosphatase family protein [Candidatus Krumholzibacteria bacterium]|nr:histidine phosphatase family protein [Candidatus Krumholzibacteria bacterium]
MLIYLIRHGRTDWNDRRMVMGREPVGLNRRGREMVEVLAGHLAPERIGAVYSGTLARVRETAAILAGAWGAPVIDEPRLDESPFERWVGMTYDELAGDPDFVLYQTRPTGARFSQGEGIAEIQRRALAAVERAAAERLAGKVALVSHSDVIKPVITRYLGMELDAMHRVAVANASVTLLDLDQPARPRIRYLNLMPWKWRLGLTDRPDEPIPGGGTQPGSPDHPGGE